MTTFVQVDALAGTIDAGSSLNSTDTSSTLVSAALAGTSFNPGCPAISSPQAVKISLYARNPNTGAIIAREDCLITAYDGSSGSCTILRGQNGTTKQAWPAGSAWTHGFSVSDFASTLKSASNLSDLANAATARTNLGLGTAATQASSAFDAAGAAAAVQTNLTAEAATRASVDATKIDTAGTGLSKSGTTLSLSSVGTSGTNGDASHTLTITTNAQGQVTSVTANGIAVTHAAITDWATATAAFLTSAVTSVTNSDGSVTIGGTATAPTVSLPAVGTAGTSGDASNTITITTDAKGRVSAVTVNAINIPHTQISDWASATSAFLTSAVTTFNTRSGAVTLTKGDVTSTGLSYSDVGADASGAAAAVQSNLNTEATTRANADSTNATAISAETARAEAAEALLAPLASPTFTGTPSLPTGSTAVTQTPNNNSIKLATTAYADAAAQIAANGYINVKSSAYGAKGDGTTDDTVAFQAALNAAAIVGASSGQGATVLAGPGTYYFNSSSVIIPPNVNLQFVGSSPLHKIGTASSLNASIAKIGPSFTGTTLNGGATGTYDGTHKALFLMIDQPTGYAIGTAPYTTQYAAGSTSQGQGFGGPLIDATNAPSNVTALAIVGKVLHWNISNFVAMTPTYRAIDTVFSSSSWPYSGRITNVEAYTSGAEGFFFHGMTDTIFDRLYATSCGTLGTYSGFDIYQCANSTFLACRSEWNTKYGFAIDTGGLYNSITMVAPSTDNNGLDGIYITATSNGNAPVNISSPRCRRDGRNGAGTSLGGGGCAGISIVDGAGTCSPVVLNGVVVASSVGQDGNLYNASLTANITAGANTCTVSNTTNLSNGMTLYVSAGPNGDTPEAVTVSSFAGSTITITGTFAYNHSGLQPSRSASTIYPAITSGAAQSPQYGIKIATAGIVNVEGEPVLQADTLGWYKTSTGVTGTSPRPRPMTEILGLWTSPTKLSNTYTTYTDGTVPIVAADGYFSTGDQVVSINAGHARIWTCSAGGVVGGSATWTSIIPSNYQFASDITGFYNNLTVTAIQGQTVSATAPIDAQMLVYNSGATQYNPTSLSGDATMTDAGVVTVAKVQGKSITSAQATLLSQAGTGTTRGTTSQTMAAGELTVINGSTGGLTMTLPSAPQIGTINTIVNPNTTFTVNIAPGGSDSLYDGTNTAVASYNIKASGYVVVEYFATNKWRMIGFNDAAMLLNTANLPVSSFGAAGANIAMGGFKFTGLSVTPNTAGDSLSYGTTANGDLSGTYPGPTVAKINGVAISAAQATILSQFTGATTVSATATLAAGTTTFFTGTTASQTLTLPASTTQNGTICQVGNVSTQTVTIAAGSGTTINVMGTTGSVTLAVNGVVNFVLIGTVWYAIASNDLTKGVGTLAVAHGGTGSTTSTGTAGSAVVLQTSPSITTPTLTGKTSIANPVPSNNAVTVATNAATVPVTSLVTTVTNNAAAAVTITITTTNAVDGQLLYVRFVDFSAASQTLTWVNTENSSVSVPASSNGVLNSPRTTTFMYNALTSKWRCIENV